MQLTQALAEVKLEQEKAIRSGDDEAAKSRNMELQLKGEKARTSFLENKVQKLEAESHELNQNLDVWRSAALEQRLRAEQSAVSQANGVRTNSLLTFLQVHISALQQENYHWREFALGADRHRLEQWLASKPFQDGSAYSTTTATPTVTPASNSVNTQHRSQTHTSPTRQHRTRAPQQAGSPLKHAISVPAIVVPQ